ncbi:MAG: flagellar motor protein MotA [Pseudomonas fluorescens]|nr:MAG: flagellar motor protein MotA [Pseudomonas fluorescens]
MESMTLIGLLLSLGLLGTAIALGGTFLAFIDLPAILIVIGGTITVTLTSFPLSEVLRAVSTTGRAFMGDNPEFPKLARRLVALAQKARSGTHLTLQEDARAESHPFLKQALSLVVDGAPVDAIEKLLYHDTITMVERHERALLVLRRAAEVAPSMGLIGTLIGLVQMLGALSDPSTIGPAMAIAILTTFYGAVLAYVVLTPIATKLERTGADDLLTRKLIMAAVLSIGKQENPRQLELHLNALLQPTQRINVFK